ncbi:MAG: electron transfer flavoprotein subunit beta/FixA family protein [Anaerolineaceae bacterium]|nr:electron transfer flavoprotein subunit beta/FixA family protein [Anaerolineaceae bacterium]
MKIVVFVKQVPDSTATLSLDDGHINWGDAPLVINPWDEFAVEAALLQKEALGGDVIAVSLGDENARVALKHALAMGCTDAILISDPALAQADSQIIAHVLASALGKIGDVDLAVFGRQSIDGESGVVATQTARVLSWPMLSLVAAIRKSEPGKSIQVERALEAGRQVVEAALPAVLTISKEFADPRFPSFMGLRKSAKANITQWALGDLGLSPAPSQVFWSELSLPPKIEVQTEFIQGSSAQEIAEKLVEKILMEKVL